MKIVWAKEKTGEGVLYAIIPIEKENQAFLCIFPRHKLQNSF